MICLAVVSTSHELSCIPVQLTELGTKVTFFFHDMFTNLHHTDIVSDKEEYLGPTISVSTKKVYVNIELL